MILALMRKFKQKIIFVSTLGKNEQNVEKKNSMLFFSYVDLKG
jgi:hypothetical protein